MKIKGIEVTGAELSEAIKSDEKVMNTLKEGLFKTEDKPITQEQVDEYLKTDAGKTYLQPQIDKAVTKGLQTWQDNNVDKIKSGAIEGMKAENAAALEAVEGKLKAANISSKLQRSLLAGGIQANKLDLAMKLADVSKLSIDGDNLIGATDLIASLTEQTPEWFGEVTLPAGKGNSGIPAEGNPPTGGDDDSAFMEKFNSVLGIKE